jgi:integrase
VVLDCGLPESECLALRRPDLDFDNTVIRVKGKGNKYRLVPMSFELRKALSRYCGKHDHERIFATRSGTVLTGAHHPQLSTELQGDVRRPSDYRSSLFSPYAPPHIRCKLPAGRREPFYVSKILRHTSV